MNRERAFQLIVEAFDSLKKSSIAGAGVTVKPDTILLGIGSPLDSIGFVTFVTALEELLIEETKKDLYLVLNEINEFNIDKPHLTADALAAYLVKLAAEG